MRAHVLITRMTQQIWDPADQLRPSAPDRARAEGTLMDVGHSSGLAASQSTVGHPLVHVGGLEHPTPEARGPLRLWWKFAGLLVHKAIQLQTKRSLGASNPGSWGQEPRQERQRQERAGAQRPQVTSCSWRAQPQARGCRVGDVSGWVYGALAGLDPQQDVGKAAIPPTPERSLRTSRWDLGVLMGDEAEALPAQSEDQGTRELQTTLRRRGPLSGLWRAGAGERPGHRGENRRDERSSQSPEPRPVPGGCRLGGGGH